MVHNVTLRAESAASSLRWGLIVSGSQHIASCTTILLVFKTANCGLAALFEAFAVV